MSGVPQRQRVAAYAVILRDESILLSRLSERVTRDELWTLPGGGLDHGEDPRDAVLREVYEETGLHAQVGDRPRVLSAHLPGAWRDGERVDAHALRIVYDGWVPRGSPDPHVVEVDGSTVESAWIALADVRSGEVPVVPMVTEVLAELAAPLQRQRLAAYALIRRDDTVLLTRISPRGHHSGYCTLPGGGVDQGERPATALAREVREECGVDAEVGDLLDVHDVHFTGEAPSGRIEDFHRVHLDFAATIEPQAIPHVAETDGTTDAVGWVPVSEIESGRVPVLDLVLHALRR